MYRARVGILLLFVGWEGCDIMVVVWMVGYETETSSFLFYFEDEAGRQVTAVATTVTTPLGNA